MRLTVAAIGRMRAGPERTLYELYAERIARVGPQLGFSGPDLREFDEGRGRDTRSRTAREAEALLGAVPGGARLIALDEAGKAMGSADFARLLERWKDEGARDCVLAIGGPDGHDESLRKRAGLVLSLGAMTWPHLLARVMLAEQLYRAMTILSGHPYHRP